jgi:hypothetical protein
MAPQVLLAPRPLVTPAADAVELNQDPCVPDDGASSAAYPAGVLIVVLPDRPATNNSPSPAFPGVSGPPVTVVPVPVLTAEPAIGELALLPASWITSIVVVTLLPFANRTLTVPPAVPLPLACQTATANLVPPAPLNGSLVIEAGVPEIAVPDIELMPRLLLDPCR